MENDYLELGGKRFYSRLFTGTGKFASNQLMREMLLASGSEMITVALRRVNFDQKNENIIEYIPSNVTILPNTSGARNCEEATRIARIAREALNTPFVKIEIINDTKYLMPDNEETLKATQILAKEGFVVLPYVYPDLVLARKLVDAGAAAVMPLGSPIGSNKGLITKELIEMLIENIQIPIIVDAGIGKPSHAAEAMEMGCSAVLVNTAISTAEDPVLVGKAFSLAVQAGRMAYLAKLREERKYAEASSPLTGFIRDD